jgi:hypothetical protein
MSVKHSDGKSDLVLVPQPTNNPDDPLNWGRVRKEYHFWLLWLWGFIAAVSVNWVRFFAHYMDDIANFEFSGWTRVGMY